MSAKGIKAQRYLIQLEINESEKKIGEYKRIIEEELERRGKIKEEMKNSPKARLRILEKKMSRLRKLSGQDINSTKSDAEYILRQHDYLIEEIEKSEKLYKGIVERQEQIQQATKITSTIIQKLNIGDFKNKFETVNWNECIPIDSKITERVEDIDFYRDEIERQEKKQMKSETNLHKLIEKHELTTNNESFSVKGYQYAENAKTPDEILQRRIFCIVKSNVPVVSYQNLPSNLSSFQGSKSRTRKRAFTIRAAAPRKTIRKNDFDLKAATANLDEYKNAKRIAAEERAEYQEYIDLGEEIICSDPERLSQIYFNLTQRIIDVNKEYDKKIAQAKSALSFTKMIKRRYINSLISSIKSPPSQEVQNLLCELK